MENQGWNIPSIADTIISELNNTVQSKQYPSVVAAREDMGEDLLGESYWSVYSREPGDAESVKITVRKFIDKMLLEH